MTHDASLLGIWQAWQPREVARLFATLTVPWWIAGGWAIDLFLGEQTREHEDIDVLFLRRDQQAVRALLQDWDVQEAHSATPAGSWPFREWKPGALLPPEVHDIWCRPEQSDPWAIQLMVTDTRDDQWLSRRNQRIYGPLSTMGGLTNDGIPYLAPEIQVFYKAKGRRPKDEADFASVLPHLNRESRQWLAQALEITHPQHPWLLQLLN